MDWITEEMQTIDLSDERLNKRLCRVLKQLSKSPSNSISAACRSWSETKAAYRLFSNQEVTAEKILKPHQEATLERMKLYPTVLLLQDTTTLSFPTQVERKDAGPINRENTRGIFMHPTLVVTPERHCLGVLSQNCWHRDQLANLSARARKENNRRRTIEDKETYRFLEGYRLANSYAKKLAGTQVVSISDREGDIYEIFQEAEEELCSSKAHWLIRASHNRKALNSQNKKVKDNIKIMTKKTKSLGYIEFNLPARGNEKSRKVKQSVHAERIKLSLPDRKGKKAGYRPVNITIITATEINTPRNKKAVEWTLLTDLSVTSFEEACEKIEWYLCRWQIEIYFKVLKSGCKIEKLQLTDNNFLACLSVYMIIAWRILFLITLSRCCPDLSCETIFSEEEWQTVFIMVKKRKPPNNPPKLNEVIHMIASLGGYMNRKSDPEPGPKTLWVGLHNLQEHIKAREILTEVFGHTYG